MILPRNPLSVYTTIPLEYTLIVYSTTSSLSEVKGRLAFLHIAEHNYATRVYIVHSTSSLNAVKGRLAFH